EPEPDPVEDIQPTEMAPIEEPVPVEIESVPEAIDETVLNAFDAVDAPEPPPVSTPRRTPPPKEENVSAEKSTHAKQEVLQFEPVNRGRFEKSEPTIVEGEDLDVPTYLRKKIKVK